jgi:hypothetical protein
MSTQTQTPGQPGAIEHDRQVASFIQMHDALVTKQASRIQELEAQLGALAAKVEKMAALAPKAAAALAQHLRIDPDYEKAAAERLKDPEQVMTALINAADPENTVARRPLGGPEKQAAHGAHGPAPAGPQSGKAYEVFRETLYGSRPALR